MKRLIWLPLGGFLLVAGATVAAAAPSLVDSARGLIGASSQAVPGAMTFVDSAADHPGRDLLSEVLADLVGRDVITQAQSDAVTQALEEKVTQLRSDAEARRELIQGFVADGVITQEEVSQLPVDDPLRVAFDNIADNGQVTLDQLRGLGPRFGPMRGGADGPGMHMRGGPSPRWVPDADSDPGNPGVSPSANDGSSS